MKDFIEIAKTTDYTLIILFGVCLLVIIMVTDILDRKKKAKFYIVNSRIVKNDYDPIAFRILFAWCIFVGFGISYLLYKYYTQ